jgi:hypothetical protein
MGWLIALGILILIGFIPVGVRVKYNSDGPLVRLIVGPVKYTLVPGKKKEKKPKKEKKAKKKDELQTQPPPAPKEKKKQTGGKLTDFIPLVKVALDFLGDFIKRLKFNRLEVKLILAGDDPCDLAMNYGRAWAALGNLLPLMDNGLNIKKRNLEIECDFTADETLVIAGADVTITVGRTLALLLRYGFLGVKEFIIFKNKRKGGAKK